MDVKPGAGGEMPESIKELLDSLGGGLSDDAKKGIASAVKVENACRLAGYARELAVYAIEMVAIHYDTLSKISAEFVGVNATSCKVSELHRDIAKFVGLKDGKDGLALLAKITDNYKAILEEGERSRAETEKVVSKLPDLAAGVSLKDIVPQTDIEDSHGAWSDLLENDE